MSDRENKRAAFSNDKQSGKKKMVPIIIAALVLVGVAGWFLTSSMASDPSGITRVSPQQDGSLNFAIKDFADGKARFYRYQAAKGNIDFFLVKSHDGIIRAAFDSCDVCYRELKGYRQEGNEMVCNNCDMRFRTELVNEVKGGCNPAPLQRRQVGQQIVIAAQDIERGSRYFFFN